MGGESAVRRAVGGDDRRAAETDVVLQREPGAVDLAGVGRAAQLPGELGALGEAGRAERVALGDAARRTGSTTQLPP